MNEKDSELSRLTTVNQSLDQQVKDCRPQSGNEQKSLREKEVMPKEDRDNSEYAEKITQLENQIKTTEGLIPIMTAEAKYIFYRDQLLRAFENVLMALKVLNDKDPEVKEQRREAAYEMMKNLTKQLEVYPPVPTFTVM
ncbi:hypothetical protein [Desulfosporosinus youngiae]|uniref:hypothetical protein n=1 Tax=Desulfosporosinus youngiae TaxID=339862 RepID=UPI001A998524|nr:hypothetical protein [Desulfosporosinus youngiae]